jgi:VanZ family protein
MDLTALDCMKPEPPVLFGQRPYGWLGLGYAMLVLYSSTAVGPAGFNFVSLDPVEAFHRFLATPLVASGSDQRADWMGNLLMLVPFGFLVAGTIWPRRAAFRLPAAIGTMLICMAAILTIKYLQLFFPPRTVTLNYIVAQGAGAAIGCACFAVWQERIGPSVSRRNPIVALVLVLRLYFAALLVFLLMPLDFALNPADLWAQAARLPDTVLALPGGERPLAVRLMLIAAASAAFIPVGMLSVLVRTGVYRVRRGLLAVTVKGLAITAGIFALSALVMGAAPIMGSILYRTAGVVAGAAMLRWLARQDAARLRHVLRGMVPWMIPPYLLALLLANRLLSLHWLSPAGAIEQAHPLGLLPLFDYYIVTKADAAKNIVAHAVMYLPVGAGLWLRDPAPRSIRRAFGLAALLSFAVELGRCFRPGLQGDVNAVVLAGLSAMAAAGVMPIIWSMLATLARQSAPPPARVWDRRGVAGGVAGEPLGEVEQF